MPEAPSDDVTERAWSAAALRSRRLGLGRVGPILQRHRFLLAFALLSSLMGISVGVAKVTTSLYALQLGASTTELGLIAGAQSVGVLVMGLPLGLLVDLYGPARLFVFGTLVAGGLYAVVPLVASPGYLLICTTLISFFMPFRFVSLNSVFMAELDKLGESKAGWYRGTHMFGMFLLGPALAGVVLEAFDFALTYQAIAVAFLVTVALAPSVLGRCAKPAEGAWPRGPGAQRVTRSRILAQLTLMARDPELRQVCLIESLAQGTNAYYSFFIVVVAMEVVGLDREQASSLVAINGTSYVLALFALGGVARRIGPERVYRFSFLWVASALVWLGAAHGPLSLALGALCLGLGLGSLQIVNLTRFARCSARLGRGLVAGSNALVAPAGSVLANLLGGCLGSVFGVQGMFVVLALLFAVASRVLTRPSAAPMAGVTESA